MRLQYAGGKHRIHRAGQTIPDSLRLPDAGNGTDDRRRSEDLTYRHTDGRRRDLPNAAKPTLIDLLLPAFRVQVDDMIRLVDRKIGGRVIESQMPILPDPDKGNIYRTVHYLVV